MGARAKGADPAVSVGAAASSHVRRRRLGLLLATTSLVALAVAGGAPAAFAACDINHVGVTVGPVSNSAAINCIDIQNSTVTGDVTNAAAGSLTANGAGIPSTTGVLINDSTVTGSVSNAGTISANFKGILIVNAAISGGIGNTGTISADSGIVAFGVSTFSGGIGNAGTISADFTGINVLDVTTFSGGIGNSSSGTISGLRGILVDAVSTFTGNVSNAGTIAAVTGIHIFGGTIAGAIVDSGVILGTTHGILIDGTSKITATGTAVSVTGPTLTGGISNAGTISAAGGIGGIVVGLTSGGLHSVQTFAGGIGNSGTISAGFSDILVERVSTFTGGIGNTGTISGSNGIVVDFDSTFGGGIDNGGAISAGLSGIFVLGVSTFSGGITNGGTISAGTRGIFVSGVSTFSGGNVSNAGTITAKTGIAIADSTIAGAIVDSGVILGSSHGILIDNASKIAATGTAISVTGPTFTGGIDNAGTLSAAGGIGIAVNGVSTFTGGIINSGLIDPLTGIAVSNVSTYSGGVANSATITATNNGILVNNVSTFTGNISNSGAISAATGINIAGSTIAGAIVDSGVILGTSHGILIDGTSKIAATGIAVSVTGPTLTGGISNAGTLSAGATGIFVQSVSTFSGGISNAGTISTTSFSGIFVGTISTFGGGIANTGTISAGFSGIAVVTVSTFSGGIDNAGTLSAGNSGIDVDAVATFSGGITNTGTIAAAGGLADGILVLFVSTFSGGIGNSGTIAAAVGDGIDVFNVSTFSGNILNAGTITAKTGIVIDSNVTFAGGGIVNSGTIVGTGGTAIDASLATSPVSIEQNGGSIGGAIKLSANADLLTILGGTVAGDIIGQGTLDTVTFALPPATTYTENNTFTGVNQVNVNSGTLLLASTGNSATALAVNSGGTLGGVGAVTANLVSINGGVLAPGNGTAPGTLTVTGSLAFAAGSSYRVTVSPVAASSATVSGTATLAGTVNAKFIPGTYMTKTYTILSAAGGLGGTTFDTLTETDLPAGFAASLDYDADDVLLQLIGQVGLGGELNGNQQAVANALNAFFNNGGTLPPGFTALFGLTGDALGNALTQASGEGGADTTQTSFDAMNMFLNTLLDPFNNGHFGAGGTNGGALGYADTPHNTAADNNAAAQAYAAVTPKDRLPVKAPPAPFAARWSAWASGYGGSSSVDGDAATGSHDTTSHIYGMAAGADYRLSPDTLLGFALGGAGFNFNLSDGLGSGRADLFQAGLYGRHFFGNAYVSGALAYGWQDVKTSRTVTVSGTDNLEAEFHAQTFAARGEAGYRFATPWVGVTPYAALQAMSFHLPSYAESATSGSNQFALTYNSQTTTNWRTELGARFDKSFRVTGGLLTLRSRLAWAHDSDTDRPVTATFQTLPGAAFTVNGAAPAADSALVSAGAELRLRGGLSLAARFEGELSATTQSYAGLGTIRYRW